MTDAERALASMDHPRSRGVYQDRNLRYPLGDGSSPLARGLRPLPERLAAVLGIIPARAGFTARPGPRRV